MPHPSPTRRLVGQMFRRQRRDTVLCASFWSVHQICEALVPVAIGLVIDLAVGPSDGEAMAWSVLGVFVLFAVLTFAWRTGFWFLSRAVLEESHRLRVTAVRRVITGRGIRTERQTGELLSIATSDAQASAELLELGSRVVSALIGLLVTTVVLVRIDLTLGLAMMVGIPLLVLALNALGPLVERRTSTQQQAIGLAAATAADLLAGLRPLRGFGGVQEASRRYRTTSRTSLRATVGAARAGATFVGASTFTTGLLLAVVALVAGWFALQGRISVGELITIVGLAAFITDPVLNLADCVFQLATSRASAARLAELLDAPELALAGDRPASPGPLVLRDVRTPGLDGLDLEVRPGEVVGVVTAELAAADALTELLSGARTPDSGTVELAGTPLGTLDLPSVRRVLLAEPHTVDLFGTTLREVLQTGPAPEEAELARAVRAASLTELVGPDGTDGLERELLDHGSNLSGGQRQRVAMARALLADRPVLVLRDPTTAVDGVTEHAMAEGLRGLRSRPDRSTVLVTTSAPLLARCDRVVLVVGGRAHSTGDHRSLLDVPAYAEVVLR
ncbi:ABC transporter transmembrane domain-containing protein [Auraticoccus monumenti]|uniref:Putative ABC transport system ATP-binding protein n=1 Tax=Auraticoccus monumenti TaxID=675864 RepID=A0A1G6UAI7_9ACTN|nr:ABC transporter ATP-binding protein [Auraticoccus monumenti]SDD37565.1 putative ABC transport system ATP-binding protein [Auraticoccus monumenti]